ncbi:MAG: hypothetical protein WD208_10240 [Dehalococcoidia bacterium]
MKPIKAFDTPCKHPNGLQWAGEELYVMDQYSDNVYVVNESGELLRTINTPTENGSGITVGGGYLWTASNGQTAARPFRSTDTHLGYIYKLDMETGEAVDRFRTPDGGGIHGIEWDNGDIWVTQFNPFALVLVDGQSYKVKETFEVELPRLHGLARDGDGIWCAHTANKVIVKYSLENGKEVDRITFGEDDPYPHGLSIKDGVLWYCDADFAGKGQESTLRGWPEIGKIVQ